MHDIVAKRAQKIAAGPSTKDGKRLKKLLARRKLAMLKLLDQMYLWKVVETQSNIADHRMSDVAVKEMLKNGEGPWETGAGAHLYWGRLALRCTADMMRCKEELPDLLVQKGRLQRWAERTLHVVQLRIVVVGESSGKGIPLGQWKKLLVGLLAEVHAFKW